MVSIDDEASAWFRSLDRSVLGRFIVPEAALISAWALSVGAKKSREGRSVEPDEIQRISAGFREQCPDAVSIIHANSELRFWSGHYGWYSSFGEVDARQPFLKLVSSHDASYHDFFEAGITDVEFIARCLSDDIDVVMALSLVR